MHKIRIIGVAVLAMLFAWVEPARSGGPVLYEPVHNLIAPGPAAPLSNLPGVGFLYPEQVVVIQIEGEEKAPFRILNDTGFTITALHWEIPPTDDPRIAPGTMVVDEDPVPEGWIQPDVAFGDIQGTGQAGKSDIFRYIGPEGPGPAWELHFLNGVIPSGGYFTGHVQFEGNALPTHYALVWYSID
jgi:hypothetical protein